MWLIFIVAVAISFIALMTGLSYKLGLTRTENATQAATIGFFLSFLPPLVLIYLVYLLTKEDAGTV